MGQTHGLHAWLGRGWSGSEDDYLVRWKYGKQVMKQPLNFIVLMDTLGEEVRWLATYKELCKLFGEAVAGIKSKGDDKLPMKR